MGIRFLTDRELFTRQHSAGWAQSDGVFFPLPVGHVHNYTIDYRALSEALYEPMDADTLEELAYELGLEPQQYVMAMAKWIAVGSPFLSHHSGETLDASAAEALAFFLASAVIWAARRGVNILDHEHVLVGRDFLRNRDSRRQVQLPIWSLIHKYAAPGVEEAMYSELERIRA